MSRSRVYRLDRRVIPDSVISDVKTFLIKDISVPLDRGDGFAFEKAKRRLRECGVALSSAQYRIYKRSVDARKRNDIRFVVSVAVTADMSSEEESRLRSSGISPIENGVPQVKYGSEKGVGSHIVAGTGPAGLFCALLLAENGYRPVVLERGGNVNERIKKTEELRTLRRLDPDTNIQFGAGGAGTFSDGKLVTRVNDPLSSYVMSRFAEFGAPEEIMYMAKPHIGTDYLRTVVDNMLSRIVSLGGEVRFHTRLEDIITVGNRAAEAVTTDGNYSSASVTLAIGHSARDTYEKLMEKGFTIEPKPFSVGLRTEHLQSDIDHAMYGSLAGHPALRHAEYALSCNTRSRGAYTFCMCPGGEVVAATSEAGGVVVNGMSRHARDGINANSAVAVSVFCDDYGNTPAGAIEFQRKIERAAFASGGGDYSAPICTLGDFLSGKLVSEPSRVRPTYMNGEGVRPALPDSYLPDFVCSGLRDAFMQFDRKIKGFASADAVLTGAETRTSAPVRIMRTQDRCAVGYVNIYPCGEGAGYAGGITSAALDGIHTALAIMAKYAPNE